MAAAAEAGELDSQVKAIRDTFTNLDQDGDGLISVIDLRHLLRRVEPDMDDEEIRQVQNSASPDGASAVNLRNVLVSLARLGGDDMWRAIFSRFDADGDGFVTPAEYQTVMTDVYGGRRPSEDEVAETFQLADLDGDGRISYDEFVQKIMRGTS